MAAAMKGYDVTNLPPRHCWLNWISIVLWLWH